jgi:DNA-binding MarR family transcriptional regulator
MARDPAAGPDAPKIGAPKLAAPKSGTLILADFVPFRLNRLADAVSQDLSEIYRGRFGFRVPEWRVLVTVAQRETCTAQHIVSSTRMHKTRVSRAVAALEQRALLERELNAADARELRLKLTKAGRRIYELLVPLALERERELLASLDAGHRQAFRGALAALEASLGLHGDE